MLNFQDPGCLSARDFYALYEMPLARAFYHISQRGVLVDTEALDRLRTDVQMEIDTYCSDISAMLGGRAVIAKKPKNSKPNPLVYNLSSTPQTLEVLHGLGMNGPKRRRDNGTFSESCDDEALQELYAKTSHPFLKGHIRVRELNKLLGTYIEAELENAVLFGAYSTTGTITGRRACSTNFLGLGGNLQNQPKHTDLAQRYRACLVARPGYIFVKCDQVSAEDWIVCGIIADQSGDRRGLDELLAGTDRHARLASRILGKPVEQCGKDTPERFLGKKTRHAGNYDMEANMFSRVMAAEGYTASEAFCHHVLTRFHEAEPGIKGVFHRYVREQLNASRVLTNPFGFSRQFFGLRSYDDNKKIFKEAYAQLPQSTVGINTGFAVLWLENERAGPVLLDDHDAVTVEVADRLDCVLAAAERLQRAFDRVIRFPRGLSLKIPIEFEVGYNLGSMRTVKCALSDRAGWTSFYHGLRTSPRAPESITSGRLQPSSAPAPSAMYG